MKKVALLGAGAVGAYFIWGLSEKLGENFCVVAKGARKEKLETEVIIINDKRYVPTVKEPEELDQVDLLIVTCKYEALSEAMEDIRTIVKEHTIVISFLNGVTSEEIIGHAVGIEHLLYGVIRISSVRDGNKITFSEENTAGIYVGEKDDKKPTERVLAVEEVFRNTPLRFHFVDNIMVDMWMKYASNISQNLPQAVLNVGFQAYKDSEHLHFIAGQLWREVAKVANAKGIPLTDRFLLFRGVNPDARFSTLQDLDAGRHTEIEMFAGEMIQMGNACGVPVPYCEYTYHLIKALEEKNDGKFAY